MTIAAIRLSDALLEASAAVASDAMERQYRESPGLRERYGARGVAHAIDDARDNIRHLAEAVAADCPTLFEHYVAWLWATIEPYGVTRGELERHLQHLQDAILERLVGHETELVRRCFAAAGGVLGATTEAASSLGHCGELAGLADDYLRAVLDANRQRAISIVMGAADAGTPIQDIYLRLIQPVQHEIGRLWQTRKISVAQEHYATAVAQLVMSLLYPRVLQSPRNGRRLVAACVGSDLHEIGVRMVSDCFELAGWDAYYVGAGAPTPALLDTLHARRPHLLAVSTTLVIHLVELRRLISAVRASPFSNVAVIVGGFPFNRIPDLWRRYGADGFASDARDAINVAEQLLDGHRGAA